MKKLLVALLMGIAVCVAVVGLAMSTTTTFSTKSYGTVERMEDVCDISLQ